MIGELRSALSAAEAASVDSPLRFEVGPVDLEISFVVERDAGASAKVRFWIVEAGGEASVSSASTQRVRLTLNPRTVTGEPTLVSGEPLAGENVGR